MARILKQIIKISIICLIVVSVFRETETNVYHAYAQSSSHELVNSNIMASFDGASGELELAGTGTDASVLYIEEIDNVFNAIGRNNIKSIVCKDFSFGANAPMFNVKNCTSITFENVNTTNLLNMDRMFKDCSSLTELDLSSFDVSNVQLMPCVFQNCAALTKITGLENWDTKNNTSLFFVFSGCSSLTDLSAVENWDTNKVTTMDSTFANCVSLATVGDLSSWDTSNVDNMAHLFAKCKLLETPGDLSNWQTGKVKTFYGLFDECEILTFVGSLDNWDVSNCESFDSMFWHCSSLSSIGDLSSWNTEKAISFYATFANCDSFVSLGNLDNWDVSNVISFYYMFNGCQNITSVGDLSDWNVSNVTNFNYMFTNCNKITTLGNLSNWNTKKATRFFATFSGCSSLLTLGDLSNWDVSNVADFAYMFTNCNKITTLGDLSNWNTEKATEMSGMFSGCSSLLTLGDLSNWNVSNVKKFTYMFNGCKNITTLGGLSNWNTEKATDFYGMFSGCNSLTSVGDLSNWNTSKVTNINYMFCNCSKLTYLNLSNWNTSNITKFDTVFSGCHSLVTIEGLDTWDTSKVTDFYCLFNECKSLKSLDLSNWDMSKGTRATSFFRLCTELDSVKTPLAISNTINSQDFNLFATFYDTQDYSLHTNLTTAPASTWMYKNKEHTISYPNLSSDYITNYNLPTSFWEADGVSINAIGKILDSSSNPHIYHSWTNATDIEGNTINANIDELKNISVPNGTRTDLIVSYEELEYKLLTLKDTRDNTYSKEIYYLPTLSFTNAIQTETLPNLSRDGRIFLGWSVSADNIDASNKITNNSVFNIDTAYAHWEVITYTVTIKDKDGDHAYSCEHGDYVWSVIEEYLKTYTEPEGYNLASWNTSSDGSGLNIDSSIICLGDVTIYPIYFAEFSVRIPQALVADSNGNCDFIISSDLKEGELELIFPSILLYKQQGKEDVLANVEYDTSILTPTHNEALFKIVCDGLSAGSWRCLFNITVLFKLN